MLHSRSRVLDPLRMLVCLSQRVGGFQTIDPAFILFPCMPPLQHFVTDSRAFGQIIVHMVIVGIDIDAARRRRFVEVDILERAERLNLVIRGQLLAIPAAAQRADEGHGGAQQFGLDLDRDRCAPSSVLTCA